MPKPTGRARRELSKTLAHRDKVLQDVPCGPEPLASPPPPAAPEASLSKPTSPFEITGYHLGVDVASPAQADRTVLHHRPRPPAPPASFYRSVDPQAPAPEARDPAPSPVSAVERLLRERYPASDPPPPAPSAFPAWTAPISSPAEAAPAPAGRLSTEQSVLLQLLLGVMAAAQDGPDALAVLKHSMPDVEAAARRIVRFRAEP